MPTTDCATDAALPDAASFDCHIEISESAPQGSSRSLRGLFFGFAATMTAGLALASWYVGVRIVSADDVAPVRPSVTAETQTTSPPIQDPMAEAYWYTVPLPQLYLQVAGLGAKQDAAFVRSLEDKGFRAQVRASPGDAGRILIGPFSTHAEMERAQSKLQSRGVLAIEAEY